MRSSSVWCTGCCSLLLGLLGGYSFIKLIVATQDVNDVAWGNCTCRATYPASQGCQIDVLVHPGNGSLPIHSAFLDTGGMTNKSALSMIGLKDDTNCSEGCQVDPQAFECWFNQEIPQQVFLSRATLVSMYKAALDRVSIMVTMIILLWCGCCILFWKLGGPCGCCREQEEEEHQPLLLLLPDSFEEPLPRPRARNISTLLLQSDDFQELVPDTYGDDNPTCVVCYEMYKGVVFLPCRHFCVCAQCGEKLTQCPLCREEVRQRAVLAGGVKRAPSSLATTPRSLPASYTSSDDPGPIGSGPKSGIQYVTVDPEE